MMIAEAADCKFLIPAFAVLDLDVFQSANYNQIDILSF